MSQSSHHHLEYQELISYQEESSSSKERIQRILYTENYISKSILTIKNENKMAIIATAAQRELIPAGNYPARCYQMIQIGTVEELVMGETKVLNKVRIGWELPT